MNTIINFFLHRARLNYTILALLLISGIYAYINTPKELFPTVELDKISIRGSYSGASIDLLDKMAVTEIEDEVSNITGIQEVESFIRPGTFSMLLTLSQSVSKSDVLNEVKDAVGIASINFPSDMNEPSSTLVEKQRSLLMVSLNSNELERFELIERAKKIESNIASIDGISEVRLYGDSDPHILIRIHNEKIDAYGLNKTALYSAIADLSYIYPLGKVEAEGSHFYLSTYNGKKDAISLSQTMLKIGGKRIRLADIASIEKRHKDSSTLSRFNGEDAMNMNVFKSEIGDTIKLSEQLKKFASSYNKEHSDSTISVKLDSSERIKLRLNTVVSNILFGVVLVMLSMYLLVNKRMAFIIGLGIPTSFIIATLIMYFSGITINMITLLGFLIALGIVVDDAIVVSENIQRYIEEGMEPKDAALKGTKEMALPVTMASLTTLFTFLPMLMLGGEMGLFIMFIPITVSILLLASLIESFVFLPLHGAHLLKKSDKPRSWNRANRVYEKMLKFHIHYKKLFLLTFLIGIPILIVVGVKISKFQLFPKFDGSTMEISAKLNVNTNIDSTMNIAKQVESVLLESRDELFLKGVSTVVGYRRDNAGYPDFGPNVFYFRIELEKLKPQNLVEKFITPYFSFNYDKEGRIRTKKSHVIASEVRELLSGVKEKYRLEEFEIFEQKAGVIKSDIEISISSTKSTQLLNALESIERELFTINGIQSVVHDAKLGVDEVKLRINEYGEKLGITERYLGVMLSSHFLSNRKSLTFDDTKTLDVVIEDSSKDSLGRLEELEIPIPDGGVVRLREVVDFIKIFSFAKISKENGNTIKSIYARVNSDIITATEVLEKINPLLEELRGGGLKIELGGENEKKKQLREDMLKALGVSMFLILIALLYMFDSFKYALMIISVIPFSFLGVLIGHFIMGMNLSLPSIIGALGLAGVVINDGIIMLSFIKNVKNSQELYARAKMRFRPILLTSITTLAGLSTLIFFATGEAKILQPLAASLGFGLAWGTVLNLLYIPALFAVVNKIR